MAPVGRNIGSTGLFFVPHSGLDIEHWPLPNVWLGVSVEDQARADERIPDLLDTPAVRRFLSIEPLLGPVELDPLWLRPYPSTAFLQGKITWDMPSWTRFGCFAIDWIIVGGESGPGARDMDPAWAYALREQCAAAGTAFFMKQMARKAPIPDGLQVRQFPSALPAFDNQISRSQSS